MEIAVPFDWFAMAVFQAASSLCKPGKEVSVLIDFRQDVRHGQIDSLMAKGSRFCDAEMVIAVGAEVSEEGIGVLGHDCVGAKCSSRRSPCRGSDSCFDLFIIVTMCPH